MRTVNTLRKSRELQGDFGKLVVRRSSFHEPRAYKRTVYSITVDDDAVTHVYAKRSYDGTANSHIEIEVSENGGQIIEALDTLLGLNNA